MADIKKVNLDNPQATTPAPTVPQQPIASGEPKKAAVAEDNSMKKPSFPKTMFISLLVVIAGIASGYGLSQVRAGSLGLSGEVKSPKEVTAENVKVGDVVGAKDTDTFRDEVEGVLVSGGVDGEGSHHLLRPGGESQSVYLTSSVLDLDQFVDHKVKIWGETFAAQRAGWLMDVGRVEVIELNAEKPFEEEEQ